jgi:hypothetical protein
LPEDELRTVIAPNGKSLGDCTPAELKEFVAWFDAILRAVIGAATMY